MLVPKLQLGKAGECRTRMHSLPVWFSNVLSGIHTIAVVRQFAKRSFEDVRSQAELGNELERIRDAFAPRLTPIPNVGLFPDEAVSSRYFSILSKYSNSALSAFSASAPLNP